LASRRYVRCPATHKTPSIITLVVLPPSQANAIARALRDGLQLQTLGLTFSQMGGDCAAALAPALATCTSLRSLDLSHCSLKSRGTKALTTTLKANHSFIAIDLSSNSMRLANKATCDATHLIEACAAQPNLSHLRLSGNGLNHLDIDAICNLLAPGSRLQYLDLSTNGIGGCTADGQDVFCKLAAALAEIIHGPDLHIDMRGQSVNEKLSVKATAEMRAAVVARPRLVVELSIFGVNPDGFPIEYVWGGASAHRAWRDTERGVEGSLRANVAGGVEECDRV
jgi:Ran GTPase-activating protein (RanGAP) involved in mRNA processing and transport